MAADPTSTLGVYVSIPFCRSKCSYCNFASGVFGGERMHRYVDCLTAEIRAARLHASAWSAALPTDVDSVYFGGGTPSLLSPAQMRQVLAALREVFHLRPDAEITLECAPGHLSDALLESLDALGIHRVSLGVQSFLDRETAAVGRLHTRASTLRQIASLREAGIDAINVDLIAGLPHQTLESWGESLRQAIACGVPHLSVYMLDVDEDSRLGREMLAGGSRYHASSVPEEQAIAEMYAVACEQFAAAGLQQYEISNFARAGQRSRHNLKYWTRQPYIGFGLDAHSFLPGAALSGAGENDLRIAATDDLDVYLAHGASHSIAPVPRAQAVEEAWFLGLRLTEGISLDAMESWLGRDALRPFAPVLADCEREGLLERGSGRVRLTPRGRLFANEVFARFLGFGDALPFRGPQSFDPIPSEGVPV